MQAQQAGDPLAQSIIDAAVRALGVGIPSLVHIFNLSMVVIGGGIVRQGKAFLDPVKQGRTRVYSHEF